MSALNLRYSRVCNPNVFNLVLYRISLRRLYSLVADLCSFSIAMVSYFNCGFHITVPYSKFSLTKALYMYMARNISLSIYVNFLNIIPKNLRLFIYMNKIFHVKIKVDIKVLIFFTLLISIITQSGFFMYTGRYISCRLVSWSAVGSFVYILVSSASSQCIYAVSGLCPHISLPFGWQVSWVTAQTASLTAHALLFFSLNWNVAEELLQRNVFYLSHITRSSSAWVSVRHRDFLGFNSFWKLRKQHS